MFDKGKYIVGDVETSTGFDITTAVCFSEAVEHAVVAKLFEVVWGAGFFNVGTGAELGTVTVSVYGKSVGLGVENRGDKDEKFIRQALGIVD